jgi:hypothetical protein
MANDRATGASALMRDRRGEQLEYRLIVAMSFPVFLAVAAARSLLQVGRRPGGPRRSLIEEARVAANTTIASAFMA